MSNGGEGAKLAHRETEQLATERARDKAKATGRDLSMAILAYAVLTAVVLLRFEGVAIEIVALVAVFGLAGVWLMGWRRGKLLYKRFYDEELYQLEGLPQVREAEAVTPSPLTPRQTEILDHVARGYMNKQIAGKLGTSEQTIKNHMSSILRRLDVNDRTQAVVLAMHNGWISSGDREPSELITAD